MNDFPKQRLIELGHDPAHLGMLGQALNSCQNFTEEESAYLGNALFRVPVLYVPEVF